MPRSNRVGVVRNTEISAIIGTFGLKGWAEGVYLAFRQINEGVSDSQGVTGESTIIISNQNKFEVDITVEQGSNDNLILSGLYQGTIKSGLTYPFQFDDASGQTIGGGGTSYFKKLPDFSYGKETQSRTWTLTVLHMELLLGGNV